MCKFFVNVLATSLSAGQPPAVHSPQGSNQQVVQHARLYVTHALQIHMCLPVLWVALDCLGLMCSLCEPELLE